MLKCYSTMLQKPTLDKTLFLLIFVDNRMNVSGAHYHEMLLTQQLMPVMHESSSELSTSNTTLQYTDRATILLEWDAHSSSCGLSCPDLNPMSENWAIKVSEMTSVAQRTYGVATPGEIGLQAIEENRKWSSKTDTLWQSVPHTRTSDRAAGTLSHRRLTVVCGGQSEMSTKHSEVAVGPRSRTLPTQLVGKGWLKLQKQKMEDQKYERTENAGQKIADRNVGRKRRIWKPGTRKWRTNVRNIVTLFN